MTATTPPNSKKRLDQATMADPDGLLLRTAYEPPFAALVPTGNKGLPPLGAADVEERARLIALKEDELRELLVNELLGDCPKLDAGKGFSSTTGLDTWSVDWSVGGSSIIRFTINKIDKAAFDLAVKGISLDRGRLLDACLQANNPQVGLLVLLGALDFAPGKLTFTLAVVDAIVDATMRLVDGLKLGMNVPRPSAWAPPSPKPLLPVPATSSYPGGHAAVMEALMSVLPALVGASAAEERTLSQLADRITTDREAVGLHTKLDTKGGQQLGAAFGSALLLLATDSALSKERPLWALAFECARREW